MSNKYTSVYDWLKYIKANVVGINLRELRFNKSILNRMIEQGKVVKESSLNQFGFYLFLCKLTTCFMRPEDEEVQADRRKNYMQLHNPN